MRLLICVPLLLAACLGSGDEREPGALIRQLGRLENPRLDEASGLARSGHDANLLWVINDGGPAVVYAIDRTGKERGRVKISGARNVDWEDLAAFRYDGTNYLVIGDIGDNVARRDHVTLYVIEEPLPTDGEVAIAWRINFSYPDGPRDAEALAVDPASQQFYVLSKRDIPAVLYTVPLRTAGEAKVIANRLAAINSLPQPSVREQRNAAGSGWAWQPTAMDFAADGRIAVLLTYKGLYYFARAERQSWSDALDAVPVELLLGGIGQVEAAALDVAGEAAFLTIEQKHAPLFLVDLATAVMLQKNNNN